jgi:hypothetical protein
MHTSIPAKLKTIASKIPSLKAEALAAFDALAKSTETRVGKAASEERKGMK